MQRHGKKPQTNPKSFSISIRNRRLATEQVGSVDHQGIKGTLRKHGHRRKDYVQVLASMFTVQQLREIHARTLHDGEFSRSISNVSAGQKRSENKQIK